MPLRFGMPREGLPPGGMSSSISRTSNTHFHLFSAFEKVSEPHARVKTLTFTTKNLGFLPKLAPATDQKACCYAVSLAAEGVELSLTERFGTMGSEEGFSLMRLA